MTNAIAISRRIAAAGIEQKAADAIAEAVVTHSDETLATKADIANVRSEMKADIARLEGKITALAARVELLIDLVAFLYLGLGAFIVYKLLELL